MIPPYPSAFCWSATCSTRPPTILLNLDIPVQYLLPAYFYHAIPTVNGLRMIARGSGRAHRIPPLTSARARYLKAVRFIQLSGFACRALFVCRARRTRKNCWGQFWSGPVRAPDDLVLTIPPFARALRAARLQRVRARFCSLRAAVLSRSFAAHSGTPHRALCARYIYGVWVCRLLPLRCRLC